jgi:hypothetical protein
MTFAKFPLLVRTPKTSPATSDRAGIGAALQETEEAYRAVTDL